MTNAIEFFDTLPDAEIRRRQALCEKQITLAFEQRNGRALANLQAMERDLQASMLKRV